jgi:DNA-binding Lrp family transcriptional regulator
MEIITSWGKKVLKELLEEGDYISTTQISKRAGISWNTAFYHLKRFEKMGWAEKMGEGTIYWKAVLEKSEKPKPKDLIKKVPLVKNCKQIKISLPIKFSNFLNLNGGERAIVKLDRVNKKIFIEVSIINTKDLNTSTI